MRARKLKARPEGCHDRRPEQAASLQPACGAAGAGFGAALSRAAVPGDSHGPHPLVPVRAIPWMKVRWVRKNRMTIGKVAADAAAMTHDQFVE